MTPSPLLCKYTFLVRHDEEEDEKRRGLPEKELVREVERRRFEGHCEEADPLPEIKLAAKVWTVREDDAAIVLSVCVYVCSL